MKGKEKIITLKQVISTTISVDASWTDDQIAEYLEAKNYEDTSLYPGLWDHIGEDFEWDDGWETGKEFESDFEFSEVSP